ncbi:MAG: arsenate reductase (glutaredoxin) [Longimicrobiales bacterium]
MTTGKITVYQKPTCSTCRGLMQLLRDEGIDYDAIDYFIDPLPRAKLADLVRKMGGAPRDIMRVKEPAYRELGLDRADVTDDELLDALAAHPELVQRPIVERGERAVVARPPERVRALLAG